MSIIIHGKLCVPVVHATLQNREMTVYCCNNTDDRERVNKTVVVDSSDYRTGECVSLCLVGDRVHIIRKR